MPAHAYPQPEATDPDPVVDALDAGLLHWVKGETSEALTCLRQARENADATGHDRRALELARAAAELTPEDQVTQTSSPTASDANSSEPRRSRLPEPPAPSKKYANIPAAEGSSGAANTESRAASTRGSLTPMAPKASTAPQAASTAPSSGRPAPPSARPPDSHSVAPSAAHLGLRGAATPQHAAEDPRPSTTPMPKTAPVKTEPAAANHPPAADAEARPSSRSDALDHRLASLRVRIDRVDPDGTIRVKLLDLAATASGEDNALLIVPQSVWQELKRNG
jgi:hypothetical protein